MSALKRLPREPLFWMLMALGAQWFVAPLVAKLLWGAVIGFLLMSATGLVTSHKHRSMVRAMKAGYIIMGDHDGYCPVCGRHGLMVLHKTLTNMDDEDWWSDIAGHRRFWCRKFHESSEPADAFNAALIISFQRGSWWRRITRR
jgi:hypothetical protein